VLSDFEMKWCLQGQVLAAPGDVPCPETVLCDRVSLLEGICGYIWCVCLLSNWYCVGEEFLVL
jgi:hypothetical protein